MPSLPRTRAFRTLRRRMIATSSAALLFSAPFAFAADASWSLGTGGGDWNLDSAWTPATAPGLISGNTTSTDTATLDTATRTVTSTIAVDAGRNIGNIIMATNGNAFGYTLGGTGPLVLSAGGNITVQSLNGGTGQSNINTGLVLQGDYTINANSNLQVNSPAASITAAAGLTNVTLTVGGTYGAGTITSSVLAALGVISDGAGTTLSVVKTGTGNWQFNGANTFTGGVSVKQGFFGVGGSSALGTGAVTLGDSSGSNAAAIGFGSNVNPTNAINVASGSSGTLSMMRTGGSNQTTISGLITLANNLTISQNANNTHAFNFTGNFTGTGNVSIKSLQGTGNTTLSGASINFTGSLSNDGQSASATVITGVIGPNVTGITQNSTVSNLIFSGTPSYSCPVTITQGSLILKNTGAKSGTAVITASAAGTIGLTVTGTGSGSLSPFTEADIQSLFNDTTPGVILAPASGIGIDQGSSSYTYSLNSGGTHGLTKLGTGTLTLTGSNTYTGTTLLTGGILNLGSAEVPGVSGPIGRGPLLFRAGTLQYSSANNADYSGRISSTSGQVFNIDTNGQNVIWESNFGSGGTSPFTKSGTGTLSLRGTANTYTGITNIANGTLEVSSIGNFNNSGSSLGTASASGLTNTAPATNTATSTNSLQFINDTAGATKTLSYTGVGETSDRAIYIRSQQSDPVLAANGTGALVLTGPITSYLPNNTTTINSNVVLAGANTADNTYSGTFVEFSAGQPSCSINLFKRGAGTWLLAGNKNHRGITFVEEGTLKFDSVANAGTNSSLGFGSQRRIGIPATNVAYSIVLGAGSTAGTLDYVGSTASTTNRVIGLNGDGTLLNSASLPENTLTLGGAINSLTGGPKTLSLSGSNTGANNVSGVISDGFGTVSLIKSGTGSWTLSGANTYSGPTSIQLGTLALAGSGSLGSAALGLSTGSTFDISALSASDYTLANGLTGSGTINATGKNLTINGACAPGALAITGNVIFDGGASSTFVASTSAGVSSLTAVTGSVQNAGSMTINPAPSFTFAANQSFILVSASGGITPGYSSVTVDSLPLENSAGVWSAVSGDLRYTYTESTGTLTVATNAPFSAIQSWRQTYFGTIENAGTAADSADFDHDGISNLVEYATNTNPTVTGASPVSSGTSGGHLTLSFPRIDDPSLTYTVQGRDDLTAGSWTTVAPVAGNNPTTGFTGSTPGVIETVSETVIDTTTLGAQPRRFLRLSISVAP